MRYVVLGLFLLSSTTAMATARPGFNPNHTAKQNLQSMQHVAPGVPNVIVNTYDSNGNAVVAPTPVPAPDPAATPTTP